MAVKHETKVVELAKLVPYEKNPNIHPVEQVKAMADSIERYGQYYPIIVDENMRILCGHGKKLALEHLGRKEGEVKVISGLTDKQKLKIVIEDNKIQSMSYVDFTKIEDIIREVGELDIIGFGTDYLDAIINESVKTIWGLISPNRWNVRRTSSKWMISHKKSRKTRTKNVMTSKAGCSKPVQWFARIAERK